MTDKKEGTMSDGLPTDMDIFDALSLPVPGLPEANYEEWVAKDSERRMFAPLWSDLDAQTEASWDDEPDEYGFVVSPA